MATTNWNESVIDLAVKTLVTSALTLSRASRDAARQDYVDKAWGDINRTITTLQMIATISHDRRTERAASAAKCKNHVIRVVK